MLCEERTWKAGLVCELWFSSPSEMKFYGPALRANWMETFLHSKHAHLQPQSPSYISLMWIVMKSFYFLAMTAGRSRLLLHIVAGILRGGELNSSWYSKSRLPSSMSLRLNFRHKSFQSEELTFTYDSISQVPEKIDELKKNLKKFHHRKHSNWFISSITKYQRLLIRE